MDQNAKICNLFLLAGVVADLSGKILKVRIDLRGGQGVRGEVINFAGVQVAALAGLSIFKQRNGIFQFLQDPAAATEPFLIVDLDCELTPQNDRVYCQQA